jgi:hypothetical protein
MTVAELIEMLQEEDQAAEVYFACDYGDYHHTLQALPIRRCSMEHIVDEAYSRSGLGVYHPGREEDGEDETETDELPTALVLQ